MRYIVLIGDIRDSRGLPERASVQETLKKSCADLNRQRNRYGLASPLTITLGDEFQAVFDKADAVWPCIFALESRMHPVSFRLSLAVGELSTSLNRKSALEMDGPAFHLARAGIEHLKKHKALYRIGGLGRYENLVNLSLDLLAHLRTGWQFNRVAVLDGLLHGRSVDEIQAGLGISRQAVYHNMREGALDTVIDLLRQSADMMNDSLEVSDDG